VLGYLPPQLLGGEMQLDAASSAKAVQAVADKLKLDVHQAAEGIYNIVNENMFGALRLVSIERGYDPRNFALVALGGAGPLHANALSILSGSWPSIIPTTPGVLSALGFLHSDIKNEFSRTVIRTTDKIDRAEIEWPNGKVEKLTNLTANQLYVVKEGSGIAESKQLPMAAPSPQPSPSATIAAK
jgi:N-methylhydantoinase A